MADYHELVNPDTTIEEHFQIVWVAMLAAGYNPAAVHEVRAVFFAGFGAMLHSIGVYNTGSPLELVGRLQKLSQEMSDFSEKEVERIRRRRA